ncbi:MAG TPA: hypothetical protein VL128_03010 [Candidatus Eisenbacteria bacterium]|nr:hypothetical protein [Candidatus Eisenbacteria bacterium]
MWIPAALFLLGAYHGLNPAMGWLFAVSIGMQEKSGKAVVHSLWPLGAGHLASVALVVGIAQMLRLTLPSTAVRIIAGSCLIAYGIYRLIRRRHPRWVGMRVGSGDLTLWSFLMASAHGAGLMLLPFVLATPSMVAMPSGYIHHMMMASALEAPFAPALQWWLPVAIHTLGYLVATAFVALLIYHKLGVAVLRRAWFNLDFLWAGALIAMGFLTFAL